MDIVVVGTGISALLLAQSLVERRCFRSLRLIGPKRAPRAHRLSYWSDRPTPFDGHADASWSSLRVTDAAANSVPVSLTRLTYRTFTAQRWATDMLARVCTVPGVEWIDATVDEVRPTDNSAVVSFGGRSVSADWVFSSGRLRERPDCWQRFMGWELEIPRGRLDTRAATLLDFRAEPAGDFRFFYQLPLAADRLFVEHVSYRPCDHGAQLRTYVHDVLGLGDGRLVAREVGATPLFRDSPMRRTGRSIEIGVVGGLAKTTTGYAITRMWRDAEQIAEGMLANGSPTLPRRLALLYRLADHFFLDLLRRAPERIPSFMQALFSRAAGDAVLAFLDDAARLRQKLEIALAMPGWLRWWLWNRL